jgi:hypothetical protein
MEYFTSKYIFDERITEVRTVKGDLIGYIEQVAGDNFKVTNYRKIVSQSYSFEGALSFLLASYANKPAVQTRVAKNQGQLF